MHIVEVRDHAEAFRKVVDGAVLDFSNLVLQQLKEVGARDRLEEFRHCGIVLEVSRERRRQAQ